MSYGRITELSLKLEHRHADGSWGAFERAHHDPSDHDPERDWARGKFVYACTSCDELVRVGGPNEGPGSDGDKGRG